MDPVKQGEGMGVRLRCPQTSCSMQCWTSQSTHDIEHVVLQQARIGMACRVCC